MREDNGRIKKSWATAEGDSIICCWLVGQLKTFSKRPTFVMATSDFCNGRAIRLTRFFMRFAGFWIWNDDLGKKFMDGAMIYTLSAIFISWTIAATNFWDARKVFDQAAYQACNAMTVLIILLKLIIFSCQREAFLDLIKFCYLNFWERTYDSFGESVVRGCENKCVYFVCTFTFFANCTVCSYTIQPIIYNVGKNETDRMLPFEMWLNYPKTTTPYYEITYSVQTLALFHSGVCYFCFDNLLCIINVHTVGQFRILQRKLQLLCERGESKNCPDSSSNSDENGYSFSSLDVSAQFNEFKDCVRRHQLLIRFVEMVEKVYKFAILAQVIIFSIIICLVSYQAILAEGPMIGRSIFIVHCGGTFTQLFMLTLTCDDLTRESLAVADAAYSARWYFNLADSDSRQLSKDLMFVIVRARRPCALTAGNFFPVSLETFRTILSTSVSYLTLLRQGQESAST